MPSAVYQSDNFYDLIYGLQSVRLCYTQVWLKIGAVAHMQSRKAVDWTEGLKTSITGGPPAKDHMPGSQQDR